MSRESNIAFYYGSNLKGRAVGENDAFFTVNASHSL
jgi:hypothetical protein